MNEVYKIQNNLNGKIYIGITIQGARTRFLHHLYEARSGSSFPIHRSINKNGKENFTIDVIEVCDSTEQMKEREKYWISFYNTTDRSKGYNRTIGGDGTFGRLHSEETKRKIGLLAIGRKASDATKKRMSDSHTENPPSKERIANVVAANKARTKAVVQYDIDMNFIAEYKSLKDAEAATGISYRLISMRTKIPPIITPTNRYRVKFIWKLKEQVQLEETLVA